MRGTSPKDVVSAMLPAASDSSFIFNYHRKAPAAILMRLRQIFEKLNNENKLRDEVTRQLLETTFKLNEALMITERIRASPICPLYTSHTTRLLVFYLFWLPIALYGTLQNGVAAFLVTISVGYAMLGLDEISHVLELPFKLMPLYQLSKNSMMDSADAILWIPPPLGKDVKYDDTLATLATPEYW